MTKSIQDAVEKHIEETGQASWYFHPREGQGVIFHDDNQFILLCDLAYNSRLGFFQVSQFPDEPREAEYMEPHTNFKTASFTTFSGEEDYTVWAVVPDDMTGGLIIGEWPSVLSLHKALSRLIETGQVDEEIDEDDERLNHRWLNVSEAAAEYDVPVDTVRYAAREGLILKAVKQGNEWRFPEKQFKYWKAQKYTPRSP